LAQQMAQQSAANPNKSEIRILTCLVGHFSRSQCLKRWAEAMSLTKRLNLSPRIWLPLLQMLPATVVRLPQPGCFRIEVTPFASPVPAVPPADSSHGLRSLPQAAATYWNSGGQRRLRHSFDAPVSIDPEHVGHRYFHERKVVGY
jgi:hypothetical protein